MKALARRVELRLVRDRDHDEEVVAKAIAGALLDLGVLADEPAATRRAAEANKFGVKRSPRKTS